MRGVYKALSKSVWNLDDRMIKSLTLIVSAGSAPSLIPVTVVIPESVKDLSATVSILEYVGIVSFGFVYATRLPTLAILVKIVSELSDTDTVLIPDEIVVIPADPTKRFGVGIISPLKVTPLPTT